MASFNPYDQYLNVQFGTADQGTLILMTFDGAIRFCREAEACIEKGDKVGMGEWLTKGFETVSELRKSLRPEIGGEVVEQLSKTYEYIGNQITLANIFNRKEHIENSLVVLERLRETWKEIIQAKRSKAVSSVTL